MGTQIKTVKLQSENVVVKDNVDTVFSILIGNNQIGGSTVTDYLGTILAKGSVTKLNLGKGNNLRGKYIDVVTNILDFNDADATNLVIAIHRFIELKEFRHKDIAPEGGVVRFEITYNFI